MYTLSFLCLILRNGFVSRQYGVVCIFRASAPNAGAFFDLYQELKRRNVKMEDYKKLYYELFNELSDLIEELKEIQRVAEEHFISQGEE